MGIYYTHGANCSCEGLWCTLTDDWSISRTKRCKDHELREGNTIVYQLGPFIQENLKKNSSYIVNYVEWTKPVNIVGNIVGVQCRSFNSRNGVLSSESKPSMAMLWQVEVDIGDFDIALLDSNKKYYFSQFGGEELASWQHVKGSVYRFVMIHDEKLEQIEWSKEWM